MNIIKTIIVIVGVGVLAFVLLNVFGDNPKENTPIEGDFNYKPVSQGEGQFKYLAFQIFTPAPGSRDSENALANSGESIDAQVKNIVEKIGVTGSENRMIAFMVGPLSFDHSDTQIKNLITESYAAAKKYNVAVGFHIDDSMFWEKYPGLNKPENLEWVDWNKKLSTGRRLDWSSTPLKIAPQLCFNSPGVVSAVRERASRIAKEVAKQNAELATEGKEYLFSGIIAGWETQISRDFDTGNYLGYCALANKGFSASSRVNFDYERETIVQEFINEWTRALTQNGVSREKVFSHIAFQPEGLYRLNEENVKKDGTTRSYSEYANFSTVRTAFGSYHNPGFSTYPSPGLLDTIYNELSKNGRPSWASSEGAAIDPAQAEKNGEGIDPESYLASLYNRGATLVTIFGWGVGPENFPFRKAAEGANAINAYRKFIAGEKLVEKEGVIQKGVSANFKENIEIFQKELPLYLKSNSPRQSEVKSLTEKFEAALKEGNLNEAEKYLNQVLEIVK